RGMLIGGEVDFPVAFENAKFVVYKVK
ncbi:MAG: hypothetical protein RL411_1764, partial [Bacteroidota bacterium]